MRYRYLLPVGGMLVCLPIVYFAAPPVVNTIETLASARISDEDGLGKFDGWRPTPEEIAKAVGKGGAGTFTDDRHNSFADLFKKRFRDNEVAVGTKFLSDSKLKVMCAATIPRWDMARVALQASDETLAVFGKRYDVDIYETFISIAQRKIGEVRPQPNSDRQTVIFDRRFTQTQPRKGIVTRAP